MIDIWKQWSYIVPTLATFLMRQGKLATFLVSDIPFWLRYDLVLHVFLKWPSNKMKHLFGHVSPVIHNLFLCCGWASLAHNLGHCYRNSTYHGLGKVEPHFGREFQVTSAEELRVIAVVTNNLRIITMLWSWCHTTQTFTRFWNVSWARLDTSNQRWILITSSVIIAGSKKMRWLHHASQKDTIRRSATGDHLWPALKVSDLWLLVAGIEGQRLVTTCGRHWRSAAGDYLWPALKVSDWWPLVAGIEGQWLVTTCGRHWRSATCDYLWPALKVSGWWLLVAGIRGQWLVTTCGRHWRSAAGDYLWPALEVSDWWLLVAGIEGQRLVTTCGRHWRSATGDYLWPALEVSDWWLLVAGIGGQWLVTTCGRHWRSAAGDYLWPALKVSDWWLLVAGIGGQWLDYLWPALKVSNWWLLVAGIGGQWLVTTCGRHRIHCPQVIPFEVADDISGDTATYSK